MGGQVVTGHSGHAASDNGQIQDLVERAQLGDRSALEELYLIHFDRIYSYLHMSVGSRHDAEDLTARVFQRANQHLPRYTERGLPFSAWLYRIAHNSVANWHRDEGRRRALPLNGSVLTDLRAESPEETVEDQRRRDQLLKALRCLPDERQHLIVLKFVEQLSNAEIGVIMNRSEGAIKSLYHRTLLALRDELEQLEKQGTDHSPPAAGFGDHVHVGFRSGSRRACGHGLLQRRQ